MAATAAAVGSPAADPLLRAAQSLRTEKMQNRFSLFKIEGHTRVKHRGWRFANSQCAAATCVVKKSAIHLLTEIKILFFYIYSY